jgi:hypothetical protein
LFAQKGAQRLSNTRFAFASGRLKSLLANHLATTTQSIEDSTLGLALQPRGTHLLTTRCPNCSSRPQQQFESYLPWSFTASVENSWILLKIH